ncbi:MAG TPA: ATP-binding cassette domain-containing protein [Gemmatimonadales bacterium]|nr:ATP-binding cassette domain-containing protein [Gemmatimonadales bacterium]
MVELRGVRHRYEGRLVLDLEHFAVRDGALLAVVGHNGAGKSTLLRLLALLEAPTEGRVLLDGVTVPRRAPAALRRRVTLVEQRPILFRGTVHHNIGYGLRARGVGHAVADRMIGEIVERLGLGPLLSRRRHELSDGEVQRVAVARALAVRPDVLLLDEPVSSADRASAGALYRALAAERAARPLAVCFASHQLEDAYRWADDIRALADGRLSPVTPENLFRVELPTGGGGSDTMKRVRVGGIEIAVMTDRTGPVVLAVPPTDIFVSREPLPSSARNVLAGRVTGMAIERRGAGVHVTADVGVELVAVVTAEAARDLALAPGSPVVFSFKASAVQVF